MALLSLELIIITPSTAIAIEDSFRHLIFQDMTWIVHLQKSKTM